MSDLEAVFAQLKAVMAPYVPTLHCKINDATELYLDTTHIQKNKKPLFFGAVQVRKAYVSFHLMPVYFEPALLRDVSSALKSRMQGKSCFNFQGIDESIFEELATLTRESYASYQAQGFVQPIAEIDGSR